MNIKPLHPDFILPVRSSELAGGYDLFMPDGGWISGNHIQGSMAGLGFCAEVPDGHVALLLPRSGVGAKHGVSLNNTCGVIDADYRGEWKACLRLRNQGMYFWKPGDRLLQMLIVPVVTPVLNVVEELTDTSRGEGGFGSTGNGTA
jgi:dUTP pyrophosphatase